uniref:Uncharacterized protein n=1 Tax=Escherichia coli TaxID=562 RepID=A0A6H0ABN7_ECOLX|nr:hypothetical protein [Escherichia coli]
MEIGSCHFHRTVFKLPSLISFHENTQPASLAAILALSTP